MPAHANVLTEHAAYAKHAAQRGGAVRVLRYGTTTAFAAMGLAIRAATLAYQVSCRCRLKPCLSWCLRPPVCAPARPDQPLRLGPVSPPPLLRNPGNYGCGTCYRETRMCCCWE